MIALFGMVFNVEARNVIPIYCGGERIGHTWTRITPDGYLLAFNTSNRTISITVRIINSANNAEIRNFTIQVRANATEQSPQRSGRVVTPGVGRDATRDFHTHTANPRCV